MVILWTDALLYLLIVCIAFFFAYAMGRPHLRAPWGEVFQSPMAMGALMVLVPFIAIGLLDSIHFRSGAETLSLFDRIATPLRVQVEKTYSAPFATHLYAKETVELPGGRLIRDYPRLKYGGAHLKDPSERGRDIAITSLKAAFHAILAWSLGAALFLVYLARRWNQSFREALIKVLKGETRYPMRTALFVSLAVLLLALVAASLGVKYHILGTDKVGEDVFYQTLKSIRTGLVIGTLTTLVMLPFALLLGVMAGYFGGVVDDVIQYIYTTLNSIPGVLLIAAAILILQVIMDSHPERFDSVALRADMRLLFLCLILGVTSWTTLCRLLRGEALKLREAEYVQAAVALGARHARVLRRHVLPNVMHVVLITVVLDFSSLVLAEAVLSYVGVGVDPSMNSWGNMINSARLELARDPIVWWTLAAAFLFMFALVLAANLFADAVRDAFDPRRARRG